MPPEPFVEFRTARSEDAGMIQDVVRSAYAKWVPLIGREPRPMNADYERAVQEHRIDLISRAENGRAGRDDAARRSSLDRERRRQAGGPTQRPGPAGVGARAASGRRGRTDP